MGNAFEEWAVQRPEKDNSLGFPILKIGEGKTQVRILDPFPVIRTIHFKSIGKRPVICPGDSCVFCARRDESSVRNFMNVLDRADSQVKVMSFSGGLLDSLVELVNDITKKTGDSTKSDPRNFDLVIVRTGKTREDTRYSLASVDNVPFERNGLKTIDLDKVLAPMPVEEQVRRQEGKNHATNRKIRDYSGALSNSGLTSESTQKPVIDESDSVI